MGDAVGDAVGRPDEEMPAANRRVADLEVEDLSFRVRRLRRLVKHRVEGGVEQAGDELIWDVVAAGGLALVAADGLEFEVAGVGVQDGSALQQRLVDAPEFLGPGTLVVHRGQPAPLIHVSKGANGVEEVAVGEVRCREVRCREVRCGGLVEQEAAERGQGQGGTPGFIAEHFYDERELAVQVGVAASSALPGVVAELARGVEAGVAVSRLWVCVRVEEVVTVLGDEEEEHLVDEPEELAVVVLEVEVAVAEPLLEAIVLAVGEEAGAELLDGLFYAVA